MNVIPSTVTQPKIPLNNKTPNAKSSSRLLNLASPVLQQSLYMLDRKSLAELALSCRILSIESEVPLKLHYISKCTTELNIYGLLGVTIKPSYGQEIKSSYECCLVMTLDAYKCVDPMVTARARGYIAGKYKLVKLDGNPLPPAIQNQQLMSPTDLAQFEQYFSPHRLDNSRCFKITTLAAEIICKFVIANDIDALIVHSVDAHAHQELLKQYEKETELGRSQQEPDLQNCDHETEEKMKKMEEKMKTELRKAMCPIKDTFSDEVAEIFATKLPPNKMIMLKIVGDFGDKGVAAFTTNLPRLFSKVRMDPKDIIVGAVQATDQENAKLDKAKEELIKAKKETDPNSVVNKQDCAIM